MNKIAVVTGGDRGIGFAITQRLCREKIFCVILNRSQQSAQHAIERLAAESGQAASIPTDISSADSVREAFRQIMERYGRVDYLVNNAGIVRDQLLIRMTDEDWDQVLTINLKGPFLVSRECARIMLKQKSGAIVNIASIIGVMGNVGQSNYAAAKAGLLGLNRSMAKELAMRRIRVNAIAPGFIETDMSKELPPDVQKSYCDQTLLKRAGKPEEVAELAWFLLSDQSSYITGQVIHIDGGLVLS
ncbi:MAG: 3-oxoacyl-[acyl-carrier-protein] reductase [Candidatus Delongbacteria bacterium]|nr:3-oxoacyl-[acyl-carrier-protein] reductase [Candidatus Delongbacteria bacterium]